MTAKKADQKAAALHEAGIVTERVKNPHPLPVEEPITERIKAGAPGSPVALREPPEPPPEPDAE
jgi:hypothetical protein